MNHLQSSTTTRNYRRPTPQGEPWNSIAVPMLLSVTLPWKFRSLYFHPTYQLTIMIRKNIVTYFLFLFPAPLCGDVLQDSSDSNLIQVDLSGAYTHVLTTPSNAFGSIYQSGSCVLTHVLSPLLNAFRRRHQSGLQTIFDEISPLDLL